MPPSTRSAIITGAAQGIGRAIAIRLASDGCNVVINDLPSKQDSLDSIVKEIEAIGQKAASFSGDVTVEETVKGLVAHCVTAYGSLDIVRSHYSHAGILQSNLPYADGV